MPSTDFYILVYRQPLFPALRLRWDLFARLYDYHNMELLDILKAYDETSKLTLAELRQKVIEYESKGVY